MSRRTGCFVLTLLLLGVQSLHAQWQRAGQFDAPITTVRFLDDLGDAGLGFVGLANGELWKTGDGGQTWIQLNLPGCYSPIASLTWRTLYEGWLSARQPFPQAAVYHTTDAGVTWTAQTPNSERPCVYFNPGNQMLFATSLSLNTEVSSDFGATWQQIGMPKTNGITFGDNRFGYISAFQSGVSYITGDGGLNWFPTTFGVEAWMPHAIKGRDVFYVASEIDREISRSTDSGRSWQNLSAAPYGSKPTGDIEGDCNQLYIQTDTGFFVSQDEGVTWIPLGGPASHTSDIKFWLSEYTLYAGDDHGTLWMLTDQQRTYEPRITLSGAVPSIIASGCKPISTQIYIQAHSACQPTILLGVQDTSSPNIIARPNYIAFPQPLPEGFRDTINVTYTPNGAEVDTLQVQVTYNEGGTIFDTTVTVLARSAPELEVTKDKSVLALESKFNCTTVTSVLTLTDGRCDSLELDSVSFGDSDHFSLFSPSTITKVGPFGQIPVIVAAHGENVGQYATVMTLYFSVDGVKFVSKVPTFLTVEDQGPVETSIEPNYLSFPPTSICGSRTETIDISNPSCQPYSIRSVFWNVSSPTMYLLHQPKTPRLLSTYDKDSVVVEFAPLYPGSYSSTLTVELDVDSNIVDTVIHLAGLGFTQSTATLGVSNISFTPILPCQEIDTVIYVENESCDSTQLQFFTLPSDTGFHIVNPQPPIWIPPGDSIPIEVLLNSRHTGIRRDSLQLWLENKGLSQQELTLGFGAFIEQPVRKVDMNVSSIAEDSLFPCDVRDTFITIFNHGECDTLRIDSIAIEGTNWYSLVGAPSLPIAIMTGDSLTLEVGVQAAPDSATVGELEILGDGFDTTIRISASVAQPNGVALAVIEKDTSIIARICSSGAGYVLYQNKTCGTLTIDSLWTADDSNEISRLVPSPIQLPVAIPPGDTIRVPILFDAGGPGTDEVTLHLRTAEGKFADTAVFVASAIGQPAKASVAMEFQNSTKSILVAPGSTTAITASMTEEIPDTLGLTSVSLHLSYDDDVLTPVANPIVPAGNWQVASSNLGTGLIDVTLSRQVIPTVMAGDPLANFVFKANISDSLSTPLIASRIVFNGGDSNYNRCTLTPAPDVDTVMVIISPACGDSLLMEDLRGAPIITALQIIPDPSSAGQAPHVRFRLHAGVTVQSELLTVTGASAGREAHALLAPGPIDIPVSSAPLNSGVYFLRVTAGNQTFVRKFVVQ